jgi:hypothetical protein
MTWMAVRELLPGVSSSSSRRRAIADRSCIGLKRPLYRGW